MGEKTGKKISREERLAAKLRENLRRRKAQTREVDAEAQIPSQSGVSNTGDGG